MSDKTRDIPNTQKKAAAESYNIGYKNGPQPQKPSYWELNNDLIEEAYRRIGTLESEPSSVVAFAPPGAVQTTINDVANSGGGAVRLDPGQTYRASEEGGEIHVKAGVDLLCHGVEYHIDQSTHGFAVAASGKITGYINIIVEKTVDYTSQKAIRLTPRVSPTPYGYGEVGHNRTHIEANLKNDDGWNGTAIDLNGSISWISFVRINVGVHNFRNGIRMDANQHDSFINGNIFNVVLNQCAVPIHVVQGPARNEFYGVIQAGEKTEYCIWNEATTKPGRIKWHGMIWDTWHKGTSSIRGRNIITETSYVNAKNITRDVDAAFDNRGSVTYGMGDSFGMGWLDTGDFWAIDPRGDALQYRHGEQQNDSMAFNDVLTVGPHGVLENVIGPLTGNHNATHGESVLADTTSGNVTVTLPAAAAGLRVTTANTQSSNSGDLSVETSDSASLGGQSTVTLSNEGDSREWVCDGADWWAV